MSRSHLKWFVALRDLIFIPSTGFVRHSGRLKKEYSFNDILFNLYLIIINIIKLSIIESYWELLSHV